MKTALRFLSAFSFLLPALALAHPGHDGHDFGWDFHTHGIWDIAPVALIVGFFAFALVTYLRRQKK